MRSNRKRHKSTISSAASSLANQTNLTQTTESRESDSLHEDAIPSPSSTQLPSGPTHEASEASDAKALNRALELSAYALSQSTLRNLVCQGRQTVFGPSQCEPPSHPSSNSNPVTKFLPERRVVSKDIQMIYLAIQQDYKAVLNAHKGALYLGVDAWQSPNDFNILGAVIYQLVEDDLGGSKLEALPLDFIQLAQSHTGEYLAFKIRYIVCV
ncbi:hypothetical protein PSTT_01974 [Puccinia striiformis]|uniref:Uncharacterized protein n=1 Tax=Puccinia striiformis TaxID=27350 RepID=A0A2S4W1T4_9BASI|nr:hypothetical protein PSTT_01974 [Puccinia striiformis]